MNRSKPAMISSAALAGIAAMIAAVQPSQGSSAKAQRSSDHGAPPSDDKCTGLAGLKLDNVEIVVARAQPSQAPIEDITMQGMTGGPGGGARIAGLPAFCRIAGRIHPEPGSDIGFEVWMPRDNWDGRLNSAGNGGFGGAIQYLELSQAVKVGQVGTSTDTGHAGDFTASAWAKGRPERIRDYGWRAIHLTAVVAKKLVAGYYGRGPSRSYFMSCSGGGRQALMEASRFPEDYDGIIAGAPASSWTSLGMSMLGTVRAQMPPGARIKPDQTGFLQEEVLRQCDGLDGRQDGLVDDPRQCIIDLSPLGCGVSKSPQCFTPPQLDALRSIYAGPHSAAGDRIAFGYPPTGSETSTPKFTGWDNWIFGGSSHRAFVTGMLRDLVATPFATPETFDFSKDPPKLKRALSADLDPEPNLTRFFDRGGKLILYHGWADGAIPANLTIDYHRRALRQSGPRAKASIQLFLVPGMHHCLGGPGPGAFGQQFAPASTESPQRNIAAALQSWVETGRRPHSLIGLRDFSAIAGPPKGTPRERLICAEPMRAILRQGADPDKASSYSCAASSARKKGPPKAR